MKSTPTQTFLLSRAQRIPAISLVFALNKNVSDIYLKLIRLNVVGVSLLGELKITVTRIKYDALLTQTP